VTYSPWTKTVVLGQIQTELATRPELAYGSILILDESADAKAGEHSAGAARQRNGRLGKVDVCQVGTTLAYANLAAGLWTLVEGELYLPAVWFAPDRAELRQTLGVPTERTFQRKTDLGWQMLERIWAHGLSYDRIVMDAFYGRERQFRADLQAKNQRYAADVPSDTPVYLKEPRVGVPRKRNRHTPGRIPTRWKVLSLQVAHTVKSLARSQRTIWQRVRVRPTERGWLEADFAVQQVWTITGDGQVRAEWLVIRRDLDGLCHYTLLNDPPDTAPRLLILASCLRYFTERVYEDAKSDLGWGEFQAQKFQAWEHTCPTARCGSSGVDCLGLMVRRRNQTGLGADFCAGPVLETAVRIGVVAGPLDRQCLRVVTGRATHPNLNARTRHPSGHPDTGGSRKVESQSPESSDAVQNTKII
jgi:SRSO17 transposase